MNLDAQFEISVRQELPGDRAAVRQINEGAFGQAEEADIIDVLRAADGVTLSLVALVEDIPVGHILFSEVTIIAPSQTIKAVGLGPMAVGPDHQKQKIGSRLVRQGLETLRQSGHHAVFVLGHPAYYPRFGFTPASRFALSWEADCPDEAFMALELTPGSLAGLSGGTVRYRPEFGAF